MDVEIVYSASRRQQSMRDVPARVSLITAAEIRQFGYRTLADALRSVTGFYVWNDRNYQYLGIRGFGRPGDFNSRVLVLVDGHRTNDNLYDGALIENGFIVDVDMIERIEIIRGPSSSIYGTGAFYPVLVNVVTRRGSSVSAEASGEAGSFGTYQGRLSWGGRVGEGPEVTLSGSRLRSHGQNLYFPEFDTPATNRGIAENADGERADHVFGNVSWGPFTLQAAHSSREKTIPTAPYQTAFGDPRTFTTDERTYVDLGWQASVRPGLELVARARYDRFYYRGDYAYGGTSPVLNRDEGFGEAWGLEVFSTYTAIPRHTFSLGAEVQVNSRQIQKNYDIDPSAAYLDTNDSSSRWGLYLEDEVHLAKGAILSAGLRLDRFWSLTRLSPRVALVLNPWPLTDIKLIFGQSSRPPNVYERDYQSQNPVELANPDLRPEAFRTLELVVDRSLGRNVRLTASGFISRIDGLITLVTRPEDGALQFQNADVTDSRGLELELAGRWESGLFARASYSFQETTSSSTAGRLSNSPQHLAKASAVLPLVDSRLSAGLEAQYTSSRITVQGGRLGGYLVTNLTLLAHPLTRHVELSGSVYNLLDRHYAESGGPEHLQDAIPQDGRSFRLKLTVRF
jgi:outer membrane receptor for ferrienterochelin and colicins